MPSAALRTCCAVLAAALAAPLAAGPTGSPDDAQFFESQVRPVLAARCVKCHGPSKQESGLRVDSREALLTGGVSGPALEPGQPDESLLVQAIRYDADPKMPPQARLPGGERAALEEWVRRGAPWPASAKVVAPPDAFAAAKRHWSFQPLKRPSLPEVRSGEWPQSPLDRFVLARLEAKGLAPSPPADRRTLLRRASLDLIGLPPTHAELAEFLADGAPDAYARQIDRLLASPRYGERWGRHWLDVARYADTKGYVFFEDANFPWAYTYRDYVIESFNADLPFDRFVLEQLAADKLPGADRRALRGLGFLTVGGRFMANPHDIFDDRIDVVSRGLLGLTVTCARCHDHKFDPIRMTDYYALYGVMASCSEPNVPPLYADPPQTDEYRQFDQELRKREQALVAFLSDKHAEMVRGARRRAGEYLLAAHGAGGAPRTDDFMLLADGADLNPKMVERWQVLLDRTRKGSDPVWAVWHVLAALPPGEFAAQAPQRLAALLADARRPVNALVAEAFRSAPPRSLAEAARVYGELLARIDAQWEDTRTKAAPGATATTFADPAQEELRQALYGAGSPAHVPLNPAGDLDLLPDRASQDKWKQLLGAVEKFRASGPVAPPRAMVLEDLPEPCEPYVFLRGNPHNRGPAVPRRFLQVLSGDAARPFGAGSGRLELARAIADPNNPLTARVLVNRVWLHHFGRGLVTTPSDFGLRSDPPSHPELLDFLAASLVDGGWSLKALHRQIMLSATYQQQSAERAPCAAVDAENVLLWRMNRRRLDMESLRDSLLAAAGSLDAALGGPSVNLLASPYPTRRTVYGFVDRLNVPGMFRSFDFPSPDASTPQRDQTTVPPQALFLMNHPLVIEAAQGVLRRAEVASQAESPQKVAAVYRLLLGRDPDADEQRLAAEFLAQPVGGAAPWALWVQTLLMSNEFAWVD